MMEQIAQSESISAIALISLNLICITLSWTVVSNIKIEHWMVRPSGFQRKLMQVILSIIIGYWLASFIADYWQLTQAIRI